MSCTSRLVPSPTSATTSSTYSATCSRPTPRPTARDWLLPRSGWPRCVRLRLRGRRAAAAHRGGVQPRRRAAPRSQPPPGELGRGLPVPAGRLRRTRAARCRSLSRAGPVRPRHRADRHWAAGPLLSARNRSLRRHRLRRPSLQPTPSGPLREPPSGRRPIPRRLGPSPLAAGPDPVPQQADGIPPTHLVAGRTARSPIALPIAR